MHVSCSDIVIYIVMLHLQLYIILYVTKTVCKNADKRK